ncbi:MAG: sensor histidine kinase [Chloroflexi bacterium]|nr:sensor histidine kinase [Chloroflexota bacterium]
MDRSGRYSLSLPGRFNSLNQRLIVWFLLTALAPLALSSWLNSRSTYQLMERELHDCQQEIARLVGQQMHEFVENVTLNLHQVGYIAFQASQTLDSWLPDFVASGQFFRLLRIIGVDGQEVARVSAAGLADTRYLQDVSAEEIYFRPLRGETYFSTVRMNDGQPRIDIAVPITENSTLLGIIAAQITLERPWQVVTAIQLGANGQAYLLDRRGNLITYRGLIPTTIAPSFAPLPPVREIIAGAAESQVYIYDDHLGNEVLGSAVLVANTDWILVIERPAAEAYDALWQARNNELLVALLMLGLVLVLAWLLARQITHPLETRRAAARRIESGDLASSIPVRGADEIADVAQAFNAMALRLDMRIREINEKNAALRLATIRTEEAMRLKDEFLAVMSHELRTPLNAILGYTGIMLMETALPEKEQQMIERIEANGERLLALITEMLDLSRIEAQRWHIVPAPLLLRAVIGRLYNELAALAQEKKLDFTVSIAEDVPQTVYLDEDALTKILGNLLINAFKFTDFGAVQLEVQAQQQQVLFFVRDTGRGIPIHLQEVIFERFRQADSSSTRAHGGLGLGLSIVRHLCSAMRGSVRVESVVGQGSTFVVTLPLNLLALVETV